MEVLGLVVQSIVSLTSSLGGQLVKCFRTLLPNTMYTDIFYEKMREAFALQKLLTFFNKKYQHILDISIASKMLTNNIVSFKQQGPGLLVH